MGKLKDKEIQKILDNIIILVDSREKANRHIIDWLEKNSINYDIIKLDSGDYSFKIPDIDGLIKEYNFKDKISIERKSGLDELSMNITKHRDRFKREFERYNGKIILMIENDTYDDLCKGNYRSKVPSKSFLASLHTFKERYGLDFIFLDKNRSGAYVYLSFYYYLRELLKNK